VPRGRILAIKWGMNPNSSSLGVDVTFLLVGATALAIITPMVGALLRWRRPRLAADAATTAAATTAAATTATATDATTTDADRVDNR